MAPVNYQAKLSELKRDDLNIIARKLKIKNYRRGTKEALIESILATSSPEQIKKVLQVTFWDRYHNHVYGTVGISLTVIIFLLQIFYPSLFTQSPKDKTAVANNASRPTESPNQPVPQATLPVQPPAALSPSPSPTQNSLPSANPPRSYPQPVKKESASTYVDRARDLFGQGQYPAALANCEKALKIDPRNREAINLKKLIVNHMKDLEQ